MIEFLHVDDVLLMHSDLVERYGGEHALRDRGLLESAVAQAQATFEGKRLHKNVFMMAAAYLFHIVRNHPFVDGNKRTGAVAALAFLDINGIEVIAPKGELYEITLAAANGKASKDAIAGFLRSYAR
ncbi:MAG: type II toxin-antitoxin system death-on-curing family toxin [Planctomycetaceae bacterium]|nr:type II toxin-antitoxin system death-on-curing family toxin [Planctomycetaceae bacterium]